MLCMSSGVDLRLRLDGEFNFVFECGALPYSCLWPMRFENLRVTFDELGLILSNHYREIEARFYVVCADDSISTWP